MKKPAALGIWLLPVLVFFALRFGLQFNGLYGQDGHEYLRYCREILGFFQGAPIEGGFFWPVGYPMFGAILAIPLRSPELALQLISVLSLAGTGWLTARILKQLFPEGKFSHHLFVLLFLIFSPFMLRGGMLVMSDLLAVFLIIGAYFIFWQLMNRMTLGNFLLFSVCSALAVMTRYSAAFLLLLPSLWVLFLIFKNRKIGWLALGFVVVTISFSPHFLLREASGQWLPQLPQHLETGWSVKNYFLSSFSTPEGTQNYRLPNVVYAFSNFFHPGFLFVGLLILPFVRKKDLSGNFVKISLAGLILFAFFLAGMAFQNMRFLITSFPLVLVLLYPAFTRMWEHVGSRAIKGPLILIIVVIQLGLFGYSMRPFQDRIKLERKAVEVIQKYQPDILYTFDIDQALRSYRVKSEILNLWEKRYEEFEENAFVLFNEPAFSKQWEGKNPMLNWEYLNDNYEITMVEQIDKNWKLYRIVGSKSID